MSVPTVAKKRAPSTPGISNREFLHSLGIALISLILSAALLVGGYATFSPRLAELKEDTIREGVRPWTFHGADLILRMGSGKQTDNKGLQVTALEQGIDDRAILTRRVSLNAADYPFLEYTITDRHPGEHFYFIWRTEKNPEDIHNATLYWAGDNKSTSLLAKNQNWQGTIIEVGIDIYGDLRERSPTVQALSLLPAFRSKLLQSIWTDWTAQRNWTQKSANHLMGHTPSATISPSFATALWAAVSLMIAALIGLATRSRHIIAYCLTVLLPWIFLDLQWQSNLSTQLEETEHLFAGKTQHQKHLADRESALYQYAQHLKMGVLPTPGSKIFLLEDSPHLSYRRLKMQYYLLPQNIYNYDRFPRPEFQKQGDYILVLGQVNGLNFLPAEKRLTWQGQSVKAELIDQHELGSVYRVTH